MTRRLIFKSIFDSIGETFSRWFTHTVLSALRRSSNENGCAAATPCLGDSLEFYLITSSNPDGGRIWSKTILKLKNFKEDGYSSFQDKEKYEHVSLKSQVHKKAKDHKMMIRDLDLTDDLKSSRPHTMSSLKETSSSLKSKISLHISQDDDKDTRLRA
ncbi:hypothetical protein Tco_1099728 [Tanacetum coccineum]